MKWYGWWNNPASSGSPAMAASRFYPRLPNEADALLAQHCFAAAVAFEHDSEEIFGGADLFYFGDLLGSAWPGFGALLLAHLMESGQSFDPALLNAGDDLAPLIHFARSLRCMEECGEAGRKSGEALLEDAAQYDPALVRCLRRAMLWDFADLSFLDAAALKNVTAGIPAIEIAAAMRHAERHTRAALSGCLADTPPEAPHSVLAAHYCQHRLLCRAIAAVERGAAQLPDLPGFQELAGPPPMSQPAVARASGSALEQRVDTIAARLFDHDGKVFDLTLIPALAKNLLELATLDGDAARWVLLALPLALRVQALLHMLEQPDSASAEEALADLFIFLPQREVETLLKALHRHSSPDYPSAEEIDAAQEQLFDRFSTCGESEIRAWLEAIDSQNLLVFLSVCPEKLKETILAQMSPRAQDMVEEDLDTLAPQNRKRVRAACCEALRATDGTVDTQRSNWQDTLCRTLNVKYPHLENQWLTFEALRNFDDREIQTWLRECYSEDLVVFMKACSPKLRERIFANMSRRAADMLRDDLAAKSAVDTETAWKSLRNVFVAARRA